jgi:EmrB/QacA subfamily drug resistance transporter
MTSSDDRLGDVAADAESALSLSPVARKIAFAVIATGMLLAALDSTIVATALPTIVGDLGGSQQLSWVVTIYLLTEAVATALAGKLGDIFGRRTLFLVAVVVFVGGSAAAGAAGTITWLIVARAVQGLGAGGLMVTATAMIADIIPVRQRGAYQGALGAVFGVTTVIGPLLGGLFTEHLSWRWAFYVNVPLAAVMIVVAIRVLPATTARSRPVIDYLGIGFISTAASLLILALHWGGHDYAWTSPTIVLMLAGAALALGAFVLAERRAAEPIMPLRLFRSNVFTVSSVLSFIVGFALVGTMTYLPSFLQFCLGTSPTESGLRTLPMVAGLLVASLASGAAVSRTGRYKAFPIAGALVMAVGIVLLARLSERSGFVDSCLAMLVLGVGIGLSMQILVLIVQNTVDYADLGVATSAVSFFRTLGSSFGAAIFGTLYSSEVAGRLPEALAATGTAPDAATSPDAVALLPDAAQAVVRAAYADALQDVFMAGLPLAALALLFALALQ